VAILRRDGERTISSELAEPILPRKASSEVSGARTKTDTGRRGENPKARGETLVKELGKMTS
jgi:hypothetical protein